MRKDLNVDIEEKRGREREASGEESVPAERPLLFPTGSTLLNLALSDDPYGGYAFGTIANIIGDRSSGKTFLSWNLFAEINSIKKQFDKYDLYYDDVEQRLRIAVKKMFGKNILKRVDLLGTEVIENFYLSVMDRVKKKRSFVYILDSFDALSDREEVKRKELKKDYPAKTILLTEMLRKIKGNIRNTNSFLSIVSQVRENIGVMIGPSKKRAGGKALGHYCDYEQWLSQRGLVKRKDLEVGVHVNVKVTKNSVTGKLREVKFDILHDYGIDDMGSMVDWLCENKFWKKPDKSQTIDTGSDFGIMSRNKLIEIIDEECLETKLIGITAECWRQLEEEIRTRRKPRYE